MSAESEWVDSRMMAALVRAAHSTQTASLLAIALAVALLWRDADQLGLLIWACIAVAVALARWWLMRYFFRTNLQHAPASTLRAYMHRVRWLWSLGALAWGLLALLHFDLAPLPVQFSCWLLVAGLCMFGLYAFSTDLLTLRMYVSALVGGVLLAMLWRIGVVNGFDAPHYQYLMLLLVMLFWQVLMQAGARLNKSQRVGFALHYRNQQLIQSLMEQTQAALDAVDVKNRFLASAAHDIRQPVHALRLYADWLRSEPELVAEITPKIVESTKAVNALFDSLFDLARLETGKIELKIEPLSLESLLQDLDLHYRPLAQAKGLQFRLRMRPGVVVSDLILLKRILGNLIANAIKYTDHGGVLVAVRAWGRYPCIEVWDTGVGIATEHQSEVFREFFKVPLHEGTQDGFGLGLYIVSRLAQILGHPVSLRSRAGRGTVVRLLLKPSDPSLAPGYADDSIL